ncbi:MAG: WD40 repeat domain-containing protein [Caldilineaceae bacterium]
MSHPTIFLSTVSPSYSPHASYLHHLEGEISALSTDAKPVVLAAIQPTPAELISKLQHHQEDIVIFHFEGRNNHYQTLLRACSAAGAAPLPTLLAQMPQLRLVFLNHCSRKKFVKELEDAGICVIIGASHHLPYKQVCQFSSTFYRHFLSEPVNVEEAYDQAVATAKIPFKRVTRSCSKPYYVHLRGDKTLRRWWTITPEPKIVGALPPIIIGGATSADTTQGEEALPPLPAEIKLPWPQALWENYNASVLTGLDALGAKLKDAFGRLGKRSYTAAPFLLLLFVGIGILLGLQKLILQTQHDADLKPYIGDLKRPALFQLSPQQGGNSLWTNLMEGFTGFHALKAGRDVVFTGVTLLPLHSSPPARFRHQMRGNLVFGLDGRRLLYGGDDGVLYAYPITGENERTLPIENSTTIHAVASSPDGHSFLIAREDGATNFFRYDTTYHFEFSEKLPKHKGPVSSVSFSQDGTLMMTGGEDGEIRLYNTATRERLYLKVNPQDAVSAVAIHPANDVLAYASVADNKIYLIDWKTDTSVNSLAGHTASIHSLEFSRDGDHLLSSSRDGSVRIWKVKEGTEEHRLGESTSVLNIAHYGLNSAFIYTANGEGALQVWDAQTYTLLDTIKENMNSTIALALSTDGKLLVTVDRNDKPRLWEIVTLTRFTP